MWGVPRNRHSYRGYYSTTAVQDPGATSWSDHTLLSKGVVFEYLAQFLHSTNPKTSTKKRNGFISQDLIRFMTFARDQYRVTRSRRGNTQVDGFFSILLPSGYHWERKISILETCVVDDFPSAPAVPLGYNIGHLRSSFQKSLRNASAVNRAHVKLIFFGRPANQQISINPTLKFKVAPASG